MCILKSPFIFRTFLFLVCILFRCAGARSQESIVPFDNLTTFAVNDTLFGDVNQVASVRYNPQTTTIINRIVSDESRRTVRILQTKMEGKEVEVVVDFCECDSHDPIFTIHRLVGDSLIQIGILPDEELIIPGNGFIYSSGRKNRVFDKHMKYKLDNGELFEVPQAFYYVGLQSIANEEITLFADTSFASVVARISKGSSVLVLLSKSDEVYLLKSPAGLVGWSHIRLTETTETPVIRGLYSSGD